MIISLLSLFPDIFPPVLNASILGRAQKKGLLDLRYINIRDFAIDSYGTVDDKPYGGGVGMVMRVDVVHKAIQHAQKSAMSPSIKRSRTILLDPTGKAFRQATARRYATMDHLILVCGHYEGIDARIHRFIDERISIGPYILTGGELPAMVIVDSVGRLLPGVLPPDATTYESHSRLYRHEPPHYTRPVEYQGLPVPEVLRSGDPVRIAEWKSTASTQINLSSLSAPKK